jgi:hypothetical protein
MAQTNYLPILYHYVYSDLDLWPITLDQKSWHFLRFRATISEILFKSTQRIRSYGLGKLGRKPDGQRHNIIDGCIKTKILHTRQIPKVAIIIKTQGQGQDVKNLRYQYKTLVTMNMHMKYKSSITYHSNNVTNVTVFKSRSNLKVNITISKIMVPIERSCCKEHWPMEYESPITYHSKDTANVKVFADRQMDRPKTICPRSFNTGA